MNKLNEITMSNGSRSMVITTNDDNSQTVSLWNDGEHVTSAIATKQTELNDLVEKGNGWLHPQPRQLILQGFPDQKTLDTFCLWLSASGEQGFSYWAEEHDCHFLSTKKPRKDANGNIILELKSYK